MTTFVQRLRDAYPVNKGLFNPIQLNSIATNKIQNTDPSVDANTIVHNTYKRNDGKFFGVDSEGMPYSYQMLGNKITNISPIDDEHEQKTAIAYLTNGNLDIGSSISNTATMRAIYQAYKNTQGLQNNLTSPVRVEDFGALDFSTRRGLGDSVQGLYEDSGMIYLKDTNSPNAVSLRTHLSKGLGFNSTGGALSIPTHELGHAALSSLSALPKAISTVKNATKIGDEKKYAANDLISDAIGKIRFAIPKLLDSIFGTHIIPDRKTLNKSTDENYASFWYDYYLSPKDKYDTVEQKKNAARNSDVDNLNGQFYKDGLDPDSLLRKASEKAGFETTDQATATISEYARANAHEAFAEAYADVLLNGDNAKDFSKVLVGEYQEGVKKWKGKLPRSQEEVRKELTELLSLPSFGGGNFVQNFRSASQK